LDAAFKIALENEEKIPENLENLIHIVNSMNLAGYLGEKITNISTVLTSRLQCENQAFANR